jgi:hypothetical protein
VCGVSKEQVSGVVRLTLKQSSPAMFAGFRSCTHREAWDFT